jgi:hypothetical protein
MGAMGTGDANWGRRCGLECSLLIEVWRLRPGPVPALRSPVAAGDRFGGGIRVSPSGSASTRCIPMASPPTPAFALLRAPRPRHGPMRRIWVSLSPQNFNPAISATSPQTPARTLAYPCLKEQTPDFSGVCAKLERVKGIEPSYAAWEAAVLPLNYTRKKKLIP